MTPIVHTRFSGSRCVVQMHPQWELYIDVQRRGELDRIEAVCRGQAQQHFFEYPKDAPGRIVAIMKEYTR